jgi:type II secretory pathway pseudopilin PulG
MMNNNLKFKNQTGAIIIFELIVIGILTIVMGAVLGNAAIQYRVLRSSSAREQAFHIAEAGINYYQWHLAHFSTDFQDGTGAAPTAQTGFSNPCYLHDYIDKDTNESIGKYCLEITSPLVGSTIVTIRSTAYTNENPNIKRTITTRYGIPSLAKYAFLTNGDVWVGDTESVSGEMHANGGIHFDGTGNAPIASAKTTYTCQTYHGCGPTTKAGIWGSAAQSTKNFWSFPVPNVDFSSMTSDLATLKTSAQTAGRYLAPSNAQGYSIVFNANGTYSVYRVTSLRSHASGTDVNGNNHTEDIDYNARTLVNTTSIPTNGIIYVEDRVWVEGTVNGRAMIAAAKLPYNASTAPSIIIPNNITYTVQDGTVSLGLLAQKDILVSYYAPNNLTINAAMIAQNGSAQRFNYSGNVKGAITIYGTIASFGTWTWSWVNGSGNTTSGYQTTTTNYDPNLLYAPPPSFPLTNSGYQQISWTSN